MAERVLFAARNGQVRVSLTYNESNLRVLALAWVNTTFPLERLVVMVGGAEFTLAGGAGSVDVPGNRRVAFDAEDGGLILNFPVGFRAG